jgi:hypothetical protein
MTLRSVLWCWKAVSSQNFKKKIIRATYWISSVLTKTLPLSFFLNIIEVSHTTLDLVFKWNITDPLVVNPSIELPQLDIARNTTEDCTLQYSTGKLVWFPYNWWKVSLSSIFRFFFSGNFTCVAVVFNLRRRIGYHMFHTFIPSALIVVMSWISFWIKPEAIPARVTLGVTSLLTLGQSVNCLCNRDM